MAMISNLLMGILSLFLCVVVIKTALGNEEFDGMLTLSLQHSLELSPEANFVPRGLITVKSIRSGGAFLTSNSTFSTVERKKLKELVKNDDYYRIRVSTKPGGEDLHWISTFVRACSLYESALSDMITLHLDPSGDVLAISLTTERMLCEGIYVPDSFLASFNSTVEIRQMENGPTPDTASYIQKMEKEKAEKAKGDQGDNRSFFAKYWMYIVPVFIFLLISGAANPDGQSGR